MAELTIRFKQKQKYASDLHVFLDSEDIGIIRPDSTGTLNISDGEHTLSFMYCIRVLGEGDVPIYSEPVVIHNDNHYYYNVSVVYVAKLKEHFKALFTDTLKSKQERAVRAANRDYQIRVERVANIL